MNSNSKQYGNRSTILVVLAFVLLSIGTAIGQTTSENESDAVTAIKTESSTETIIVKQEEASLSNMSFVLWFMSAKQDPNAKIAPCETTAKKQFMTSGTAPNRLLIKSFLKKAVNFEAATV